MRPKTILLITVMITMTALFTNFQQKFLHRPQAISQTGNMPAPAVASAVPTVRAYPVKNGYKAPVVEETVRTRQISDVPYATALNSFVQNIENGKREDVVGVFVPGTLALRIRQQPDNNANFVSTEPEIITQFNAASSFKTIGLLAHNYLAGTHFYDLKKDQTVIIVYGDGNLKYYKVNQIQRYQALTPTSPQSDFVDLNNTSEQRLSAGDVFQRIYTNGNQVVFQTCILNNGDPSWGRLFIIATPVENGPSTMAVPQHSRFFAFF